MKINSLLMTVALLGTTLLSTSANALSMQQRSQLNNARECIKSDAYCAQIGASFVSRGYMKRDCGFTPDVVIDDDVVDVYTGDFLGALDQMFEGFTSLCQMGDKTYENAIKNIKVIHVKKGTALKSPGPNLAESYQFSWENEGPELSVYLLDGPAYNVSATLQYFVENHK